MGVNAVWYYMGHSGCVPTMRKVVFSRRTIDGRETQNRMGIGCNVDAIRAWKHGTASHRESQQRNAISLLAIGFERPIEFPNRGVWHRIGACITLRVTWPN